MLQRYSILLLLILVSCKTTKTIKQNSFPNKQNPVITILENKSYPLGASEPSICINRKNTNNIIAGSILKNVHTSSDGGKTWQTSILKSKHGVFGDPVLISDNEGRIYYLHLSDPENRGHASDKLVDRIVIQRSDDEGKTWTKGVGIGHNPPKQQDKHCAAINPKTGELIVTWTEFDKYGSHSPYDHSRILFSKSSDHGDTWTKPISINELEGDCLDNDNTTEGAVPAIDNNGNIYVAWAYHNKIYFDKSSDGGKTWLDKDIIIAQQFGGWVLEIPGMYRANGMPVLGIDNSNGKFSGSLYVNWADQRNGKDNTDIFISRSADQGKTWSAPIRVNQDKTKTHQFYTWMSIDPKTGYIYIIYYDRSKYQDKRTDVNLAISKDGGKTFSNQSISNTPFVPIKLVFMGDYNYIDAYNGIIRPIWTHYSKRKLSVKTAIIQD